VRHTQAACRSREDFRGIVYGKGRAVFDGRIQVDKGAQKTDALLTNKNLLLCEDAEVDTKPQLEIYADDVKCGHGTAVGRIDPDQIYYLRSRGIPEREAQQMLCLGFAEQILADVKDKRLHDFIHSQIAASLAQGGVD
jgi:Fe-S cluster assembly protein SufD